MSILSAIKPSYCQAQTLNFNNLSLGTVFGAVYGHSEELVYPLNTPAELYSELLYDMKPVFYAGIQIDYGRANIMRGPGFFASLIFKAGIPADSGIHENRDWMSAVSADLTNFSSHTNKTNEFFWIDLSLGASIPVGTYFYITPFISGSWMHFAFTGRDGYYQYAERSGGVFLPIENAPIIPLTGDVIRYQQDWLLLAAGLSVGSRILFPFSFELSFQITPLTYCAAKDEHLLRSETFLDFSSWGLFFEPRAAFSLIMERFELSLEASYRSIGRTRGDSYSRSGSSGAFRRNGEAGAALTLFDARFLFRAWL